MDMKMFDMNDKLGDKSIDVRFNRHGQMYILMSIIFWYTCDIEIQILLENK